MAANYIVVKDAESGLHLVKETKTEHIIDSFRYVSDARVLASKLNKGLAFDGWTPKFFLK